MHSIIIFVYHNKECSSVNVFFLLSKMTKSKKNRCVSCGKSTKDICNDCNKLTCEECIIQCTCCEQDHCSFCIKSTKDDKSYCDVCFEMCDKLGQDEPCVLHRRQFIDQNYLNAIRDLEEDWKVKFPKKVTEALSSYNWENENITQGCEEQVSCATPTENLPWHYAQITDEEIKTETKIVNYKNGIELPKKGKFKGIFFNPCNDGDTWVWHFMSENQGCMYWYIVYSDPEDQNPEVFCWDEDKCDKSGIVIKKLCNWKDFSKENRYKINA